MSNTKAPAKPQDVAVTTIAPAFMLSELKRAFEIGFLIFVPFLIIDMAVASILMSMGMMMLPPVIISLPFQADLLRAGGRLAPGRGQPGGELPPRPAADIVSRVQTHILGCHPREFVATAYERDPVEICAACADVNWMTRSRGP